MPSLNFPINHQIPDLDELACQAEELYSDYPDLCLFRCRQLLELLVQQYAKKHRINLHSRDGLDANLQKLLQKNILSKKDHSNLDKIRKLCNDACHYSPKCTNPIYWRTKGLDVLWRISVQWANFLQQLPPNNLVVPTRVAEQFRIDSLHVRLNLVEHIIDYEREQIERAEILLQELEAKKEQWESISDEEYRFLYLRLIGLRLAINNHKGIVTDVISPDKMEIFLEQDDVRILSELSRYHNRLAVRFLNILDTDSTLEILNPWLEREEAKWEYLPEVFRDIQVYQQSRGELLGTKGQALCMKGFCEHNIELIHDGIACFHEARSLFREEIDRHRQDSYLIHAYIDLLRLEEEITTDMRDEMIQFVNKHSALNIRENHIGTYDLYLTLKIIHVLGLEFSILSDVQYWLSNRDWTNMFFPMELILGHYLLIRGTSAKNEKKYHEALCTVTQQNNIRGFIAHVFYKKIHPNKNISDIEQRFQDWIQNENIENILQGKQIDHTGVLPMYYY
jgi:hypothetical protein